MLSNEEKYQFLKSFNNIPLDGNVRYFEKIKIPVENSNRLNTYSIDYNGNNILLLNNERIYERLTEEEQAYREEISNYPPQLKMREIDLEHTLYGKPDRIEKSHDYYAMQPRKRHKTYYWYDKDFQATVSYTYNVDGTVYGNIECPDDNGYVWSVMYKDGKYYKSEDLSGDIFYLN